jgi:hypothetical protein
MNAMAAFNYKPPENPWEMVDTPMGRMESWRAATLMTGETSASAAFLKQFRADSNLAHDALNAREDAVSRREAAILAREALIRDAVTKVHALLSRADSLVSRAEEARSQPPDEPLDEPPRDNEVPSPSGELHDLPPKEEASELPVDPPEEEAPDDDDEPNILQRAPAPMQDPNEPQIPSTTFQE